MTILMKMRLRVSNLLIQKLKEFEGLRLVAYKPTKAERWYTICYGHSAGDVKEEMIITEEEVGGCEEKGNSSLPLPLRRREGTKIIEYGKIRCFSTFHI